MKKENGFGFLRFAIIFQFLLTCLAGQAQSGLPHKTVLRAARLIDGKTNTVMNNGVIVVEGERITAAGPDLPVPEGASVIDLGDATLLPGLIDAHTHLLIQMDGANLRNQDAEALNLVATQSTALRALLGARLGREDLEAGITTVRDLGNSGVNGDVALAEATERGWVPGPRIVPSTRALTAHGGQIEHLIPEAQGLIGQEYAPIRGPESARQAVRQALYDGARCIKVIVNGVPAGMSPEEMKAIVEEAHANGVKVAAHALDAKTTRIAAEAGADSIEHAYVISDDVLKMMAERHIYLVPTDATVDELKEMTEGGHAPGPEEKAEMEAAFSSYVRGLNGRLRRALKFGVPIAMGSDMYLSIPHRTRGEASLMVLQAYADAGMTSMQIIQAATRNGAELLGMQDRIGALEAGKLADIIAVPGDASKDAKALQHVKFVMKGGVVVRNK